MITHVSLCHFVCPRLPSTPDKHSQARITAAATALPRQVIQPSQAEADEAGGGQLSRQKQEDLAHCDGRRRSARPTVL